MLRCVFVCVCKCVLLHLTPATQEKNLSGWAKIVMRLHATPFNLHTPHSHFCMRQGGEHSSHSRAPWVGGAWVSIFNPSPEIKGAHGGVWVQSLSPSPFPLNKNLLWLLNQ